MEIPVIFDIPASTILPATLNRYGPGFLSKLFLRDFFMYSIPIILLGIIDLRRKETGFGFKGGGGRERRGYRERFTGLRPITDSSNHLQDP